MNEAPLWVECIGGPLDGSTMPRTWNGVALSPVHRPRRVEPYPGMSGILFPHEVARSFYERRRLADRVAFVYDGPIP